jgi:hypothetical protein
VKRERKSIMNLSLRNVVSGLFYTAFAATTLMILPSSARCDDPVLTNPYNTPLVFGGGGMQTDQTQNKGSDLQGSPPKENPEKKPESSGSKTNGDSGPNGQTNGGIFGPFPGYLSGGR